MKFYEQRKNCLHANVVVDYRISSNRYYYLDAKIMKIDGSEGEEKLKSVVPSCCFNRTPSI